MNLSKNRERYRVTIGRYCTPERRDRKNRILSYTVIELALFVAFSINVTTSQRSLVRASLKSKNQLLLFAVSLLSLLLLFWALVVKALSCYNVMSRMWCYFSVNYWLMLMHLLAHPPNITSRHCMQQKKKQKKLWILH